MNRKLLSLVSLVSLAGLAALIATPALLSAPAMAHHSHAMFDFGSDVEISGTVKEFRWTNPHSWLHIMVEENGAAVEYAIEMGALAGLVRMGWAPTSVVPGDVVTVSMHPLFSGEPGGELRYIVLPDGSSLGEGHENAEFPQGINTQ
ncbi:MAG: DUF6152 family protein [Alphaproteobacteria bacterium]|jgi:hypothetical protein